MKNEGLIDVYAGLKAFLIRSVANNGFYYLIEQYVKNKYLTKTQALHMMHIIQITTIASVLNTIVCSPFWLVSTKMTLKQHTSGISCIKAIHNADGLKGFFSGLGPSLILVINPIIQFALFEFFKRKTTSRTVMSLFILGAISKLVAMISTYPLLTLRTRMQADKTSAMDCLNQILSSEGFVSFFKGMKSKMLYTVLNAGFVMTTQEKLKYSLASMLRLKSK